MANIENLTRMGKEIDSREKAQKLGAMGGKKKGENAKLRRTFAELGKAMMDCKPSEKEMNDLKEVFPDLDEKEITNRTLMIRQQMMKAVMEGDTRAFEVLRDTIGEKPVEKVENTEKKIEGMKITDGEEVIELK